MSTKPLTIAKIKAAGATEVVQRGESWREADEYLREEILPALRAEGDEEGIYVPPFDDPAIWEGVGSMMSELGRQLPVGERPDAVVCCVGGGGLLSGICDGLHRIGGGWEETPIVAVETAGAESLAKSIEAGGTITLPAITSIATSLGARRVAETALQNAQEMKVRSVVVTDAEACLASCQFADDERILVEAACGASLALAYQPTRLRTLLGDMRTDSRVVIVVCGGINVTIDMLAGWREEFGRDHGARRG